MNEKELDEEKHLLKEKKKVGQSCGGQEEVEKEVEKVIEVKGRGPLKVRTDINPPLIFYVKCMHVLSNTLPLLLFHFTSLFSLLLFSLLPSLIFLLSSLFLLLSSLSSLLSSFFSILSPVSCLLSSILSILSLPALVFA